MMASVSIPVTIKSRIGIDDQDSFEFFADFITKITRQVAEFIYMPVRRC